MEWQYEKGRIFCEEDGEVIAETTFVYHGNGVIDIDHTYISPKLRGQGAAGKMMEVVAEYLQSCGMKATATCTYAHGWLDKNRDKYGI